MDDIESAIRSYIIEKFLPKTDPQELQADTPLLASGILDSLATIRLVMFLEERFGIDVSPSDANVANMATISRIGDLVRRKQQRS